MTDPTRSGPYGRAAQDYRRAGWHGVLPIGNGPATKYPPPSGWTGHDAPYPSPSDVAAWQETHGDRNIGLRLPVDVIGLDVDNYAKDGETKHGGATLAELEARLGSLPPTWITSARSDGVSGIRLFRVPPGLNWPGEAGPNIEIIQAGHRYALVWPSVNPEAGGARYEWLWQSSSELKSYGTIPTFPEIIELPEAWIKGLTLPYDRAEKADLASPELSAWWESLTPGPVCPTLHRLWMKTVDELKAMAGSRHETARDAVRAALAYGAEGHAGAAVAVALIGDGFRESAGEERFRGGEWHRLVAGAVQLAAAKYPIPGRLDPCLPPDVSFMAPPGLAIANPTVPGAAAAAAQSTPPTPGSSLTLPAEFWAARPSLAAIRQAAHSKVRSADVVFYGTLVRVAALAPHTLRADTGVGTPASLNLFAAVVGPSGAGKSSGLSVARLVIPAPHLEEFPLGSGEGLAEAYMGMDSIDDPTGAMKADGSPKKIRQKVQVRHNALAHADEGASLNKMLERTGSTVGEALRSAWSGETIGQKNGREETTRVVHSGSYALGLLIGYQPSTVLPLLADKDAGTPQRFLYAWAIDPTIPGREARVPWPGETPNPFPPETATDIETEPALFLRPVGPDLTPITFAQEIRDELYDTEHAKASGTLPRDHPLNDEFRSQHTVLKAKVASHLALLDGARRHVVAEDWRLAQIVIDTSDTVRMYLQAVAGAREEARREAEDMIHSRRAVQAHAAVAAHSHAEVDVAVRRVAVRLAERVRTAVGETRRKDLRAVLASRDRPLLDDALTYACEEKWIEESSPSVYRPGVPLPGGQ